MIYDEFVKDAQWCELKTKLLVPGLTHKDRMLTLDELDEREKEIRKEYESKMKGATNAHNLRKAIR